MEVKRVALPNRNPNHFLQLKKQTKALPFIGPILDFFWTVLTQPKNQLRLGLQYLHQQIKLPRVIKEVQRQVAQVECTQPLYHFTHPTQNVANNHCEDLAKIIFQRLNHFSRGARILEMNCCLGYFSYYFADHGYIVEGLDPDPRSIEICHLLQNFNKSPIAFSVGEFSHDFIATLAAHRYDIIFLFKLIPILVSQLGVDALQNLMVALLEKIPILLVEAPSEAAKTDVLYVFAKCVDASIEQLPLPSSAATIYLIMKNTVTVQEKPYKILSRKFMAYLGAGHFSRFYYDCEEVFIKKYLVSPTLQHDAQILQEIAHYQQLPQNPFFPDLLNYVHQDDAISAVFSKLPGTNLYDLLTTGAQIEALPVFRQIVHALIFLFEHGLFHNDVRLWNVMYDEGKAYLFDLGLAAKIEKEQTTLALLWLIHQLHHLQHYDFEYPITAKPRFEYIQLQEGFKSIVHFLERSSSFAEFVDWFREQSIAEGKREA